jgi:hypothetical protein
MQARVASLASAAARSTSCGNVVHRLIRNHGVHHVTIVLRMIVESEGNEGKLIADYNDFE